MVLYHATESKNVESILKEGLLLSKSGSNFGFGEGFIYLDKTESGAKEAMCCLYADAIAKELVEYFNDKEVEPDGEEVKERIDEVGLKKEFNILKVIIEDESKLGVDEAFIKNENCKTYNDDIDASKITVVSSFKEDFSAFEDDIIDEVIDSTNFIDEEA